MSTPIYDPFDDPTFEEPVTRYVNMILLNANKRCVERIHFERSAKANAEDGEFTVSFEKDGICEETDTPPRDYFLSLSEQWPNIIRKLKVIARMVDYGPKKSLDGNISLRLAKKRSAEFYLTTNPDPNSGNKVTLVNRGTKETPVSKETNVDPREVEKQMQHFRDDIPTDAKIEKASIVIAISKKDDV